MSRFDDCRRGGFTLVELMVVIAIIGVIAALLLPAVQMAREAARATSCRNHLRQIGLASDLFYDVHQAYPPARIAPRPGDMEGLMCGGMNASWLVRLLPWLEQQALYETWDVEGQWYLQPPASLRRVIPVYVCPSRRSVTDAVGRRVVGGRPAGKLPCGCPIPPSDGTGVEVFAALGDYAGNHGDLSPGAMGLPSDFYHGGNGTGVIITSRARCFGDKPASWLDRITHASVTDGLSNTWLAGEKHMTILGQRNFPEDSPLWDGEHLAASTRVAGLGMRLARGSADQEASYLAFGSWHPGGVPFVMADSSVHFFSSNTDVFVLGQLAHRSDGK